MAESGILLVDKPQGVTSHDIVARARRARGTRKVGHAGTLDPMATGLLLVGVEGATRLLTYLVGLGKTYEATIRLGQATTTDDADGDVSRSAAAADVAAVTLERIADEVARLTGAISQVPSAVSAIKVDGRRAYDRVRAGEDVQLAARDVVVSRFDVLARRDAAGVIDLDVIVDCSSGTYIRALARDLGDRLGVGGHLTRLRRTAVGPFSVDDAAGADALEDAGLAGPADVAGRVLGRLAVPQEIARDLRHGKRVAAPEAFSGLRAAIDEEGVLVGIVERRGREMKSVMNMPEVTA
ncbi:tRNA pseudouridine(55) synthase TruB [Microbacterium excoecariae]|uniref:tRNA pseudouridine(55) synthase TruB n=1 Tax=Microbacterium excoecariae TaxID=2715210 RepID=UPI00140CDE95|nr:tRNA pseudouridine(55) synthase TruB [Microbacterium excoecariae]NHI16420.1 tRNA pseudouridine(55) synthase TruB [Microbacterium excoecariae]